MNSKAFNLGDILRGVEAQPQDNFDSRVRKLAFVPMPQGQTPVPPQQAQPTVDPNTGMQVDPNTGLLIDPQSGLLVDPQSGTMVDPQTMQPVAGPGMQATAGMPTDPSMAGGAPLDPSMVGGAPMDPSMAGGAPMGPSMAGGAPMDPSMAGGDPNAGGLPPEIQQVIMMTIQQTLEYLGVQPGQAQAAPAPEKPKKASLDDLAQQVGSLTQMVASAMGVDPAQFQPAPAAPAEPSEAAPGESKTAEENFSTCSVSSVPMNHSAEVATLPTARPVTVNAGAVAAARKGQK